MSSEFENASTEKILSHIIARDVAYGVEMARSIGHKMPREYDVGYSKRIERRTGTGMGVRVKLRLDDATYEVPVFVPHLDSRCTMLELSEAWEAIRVLIERALELHLPHRRRGAVR
jgi:hypothetical protein